MARLFVPVALFAGFTGCYLVFSGGPPRVRLLAVACFFLGFGLPALIAGTWSMFRRRWLVCLASITVGMLLWDALAFRVIGKLEVPFAILREGPWLYLVGLVLLGLLVAGSVALSTRASRPAERQAPNEV